MKIVKAEEVKMEAAANGYMIQVYGKSKNGSKQWIELVYNDHATALAVANKFMSQIKTKDFKL